MMRIIIAVCVASTGASAPALAQRGTRIPDPAAVPTEVPKSQEAVEAQRVMNAFGECIVKTTRRRAEDALAMFSGSQEARSAIAKLASSDCLMHGRLSFSPELFRGSLYEALYRSDFRSREIDVAAAPAIDYFHGALDRASEETLRPVALRQFADCTVRANPPAARALIMSRVGGSEETAAFRQLSPAASQCLPDKVELKFSRPLLRGLVAETMYRLAKAAAAPVPPSR